MKKLNTKALDLESIIEFAPDPILLIENNCFIYCNEAATQIFKSNKSYILNKTPWDISPPYQPCGLSSKEKALKILSNDFESITFEWIHLRPNGESFPVEVKLTKKNQTIIQCSWRDITERKQKEDYILNQQFLLKGILDNMAIPAFTVNTEGIIMHWNKACELLTNKKAEDMIGTNRQWEPFYKQQRPVLADIVAQNLNENILIEFYGNKYKRSPIVEGSIEAEGLFEILDGKYLFFTASPLYNSKQEVIGAIETFQDVTDTYNQISSLTESSKEKDVLIFTDKLTGLWNVRKLSIDLEEIIKQKNESICVAMIDADNFKHINDKNGHLIGDKALSFIGNQIKHHIRETDAAFRYGGEEFAIILHANLETSFTILERLRKTIEENPYCCCEGTNLFVKVSIGLTTLNKNDSDKSVLNRADQALYSAKQTGKNKIVIIE